MAENENFIVDFGETTNLGGGGGTTNFNELTNRPKYNGVTMTGNTDIPEVKNYTAGNNISISSGNVISAVDTKYTAGDNITISDQNVISATGTTYVAGEGLDLTGNEFSVDTTTIQEKLTPGDNVSISGNEISATDTTYTAGTGLDLTGTEFSADTTVLATKNDLSDKQDKLTAGSNITIAADNTISATDTTYTAGTNVSISSGNVISATDTTYTAGTGLSLNGTEFSADTSVLATQTDLSGKQDTLTAGSNITISDNTISATDTTYSAFTGTDGTAAGTAGLVPAPATTDAGKFLKADGTWDTAGGGGPTVVQTTGTSTTDVMSQNATTSMVFDSTYPSSVRIGTTYNAGSNQQVAIGRLARTRSGVSNIAIGNATDSKGSTAPSVAIGGEATAAGNGSIALGSYSNATQAGQMDISTGSRTTQGYNSSNYRLLTGLYDPQSDHDAATKGYVDTAVAGASYDPTISNNTLYL